MAMNTSMTKRSRQAKMAAKGAGFALQIAKEMKDPKYKMYKKFNDKRKSLKAELINKYRGKARSKLGANF
jgi:hypothetical protein